VSASSTASSASTSVISLRAALTVADTLLIPVQPRSFDVWALDQVAVLVAEAREAGVKARKLSSRLLVCVALSPLAPRVQIAVCSTSNEASVSGIVRVGLGADVAKVMRVFAGDVVPRKKPDPAIYLLAAKELDVEPGRCVVVEDSHIGVRAAKAAGMRCMVTTSG
jgi:beta-phosphoglucomutase-like phosphatase (HAD superfamily)